MQRFRTPEGRAGDDQLKAMEECVQSELEQMFWQSAKLAALRHGVGRAAASDSDCRANTQKRECQAQIVFHAGRGLELALHLAYARCADRIMGREYPGADKKQITQDRRSHSLAGLFQKIVGEMKDQDQEKGRKMEEAFEEVYLTALNRGVLAIRIKQDDGALSNPSLFLMGNDNPFIEKNRYTMRDGAEQTHDHYNRSVSGEPSAFGKMPVDTFGKFLQKADKAYYGKNMRWAQYNARDDESGRSYVVAGPDFFARLIQGVVELSRQKWTWHDDLYCRWLSREKKTVYDDVCYKLKQHFKESVVLPKKKLLKENKNMLPLYFDREVPRSFSPADAYERFHSRLEVSERALRRI